MDLNRIVFPAPEPSYTPFTLDRLMYVPKVKTSNYKSGSKTLDTFESTLEDCKLNTEPENNIKTSK